MPLALVLVLHRVGVRTDRQYGTMVQDVVKHHHLVLLKEGRGLHAVEYMG